ncbi:MAG: SDR family oxidoreductase [Saprospiraceae bacterium]|nr:SDR family oxidoreductase [Saprospiraceae bacterium]
MSERIAFITGGSRGIGFGIAKALLDFGMKVAFTGRNEDRVKEAVSILNAEYPGKVIGLSGDASKLDELQEAVGIVNQNWGKIHTVIANAGVGYFAPVDELSVGQWKETIDTNLTGAFFTLKACMEDLKETKGYYITIASLAGTNFFEKASAYNASKFGLVGFTQAAMLDLRKYDIKVSTIMPGSVATHFNQHEPSAQDAWKIQPEDLGQLVVDLLKMNPRTLPSKIEVRPSRPS